MLLESCRYSGLAPKYKQVHVKEEFWATTPTKTQKVVNENHFQSEFPLQRRTSSHFNSSFKWKWKGRSTSRCARVCWGGWWCQLWWAECPHLLNTDLVSPARLKNGRSSPYAEFTYSSVTVGVIWSPILEWCEKKNIHLTISSPTIGTHKPGNRPRGEDHTNMASDFYASLVNAIYWER